MVGLENLQTMTDVPVDQMHAKKKRYHPFHVTFGSHNLVGDVVTSDTSSQVLILHGAGESGRCRFNFFREHLLSNGISSCAFDFIGHGDTGGDIKRSNLYERTKQACKTIRVQRIPLPLKIVGASMGAYTAVKLTKYYEIE